jgi:hypothetical protein
MPVDGEHCTITCSPGHKRCCTYILILFGVAIIVSYVVRVIVEFETNWSNGVQSSRDHTFIATRRAASEVDYKNQTNGRIHTTPRVSLVSVLLIACVCVATCVSLVVCFLQVKREHSRLDSQVYASV